VAEKKTAKEGSTLAWVGLGVLSGVGLYFLSKSLFKKPSLVPPGSRTEVMPLPTVASPTRFVDFNSVVSRYGQLRDLYHMGPAYKSGPEVIAEINGLELAARNFADIGQVSQVTAEGLVADMEDFKAKVMDTMQFLDSLKNQPAPGIGRRQRWPRN
jgi:hypothetical protein